MSEMEEAGEASLMGMTVLTDDDDMAEVLESDIFQAGGDGALEALEKAFPGIQEAIQAGLAEVDDPVCDIKATHLVYFNHRVQLWALGEDRDPSTARRVPPASLAETLH